MVDDLYDQLVQATTEAENSKREAFEESIRCPKAKKAAMDAIHKAKAAERLYYEEFRKSKEKEEELAKCMEELEIIKSQQERVLQKFQKVKLTEKEMQEKLLSVVALLQKYKMKHDGLQVERDDALRAAKQLREQYARSGTIKLKLDGSTIFPS